MSRSNIDNAVYEEAAKKVKELFANNDRSIGLVRGKNWYLTVTVIRHDKMFLPVICNFRMVDSNGNQLFTDFSYEKFIKFFKDK